MDLDRSTNGLYLPDNFTDIGLSSMSSNIQNDVDEKMSDQSLYSKHTRLHQTVSDAFNRIGFQHTLEHVITAKDIRDTYSIRIPSTPFSVFSIDIANVEEQIAIEIDGPGHYVIRLDENPIPLRETQFLRQPNGELQYMVGWNGEQQAQNGSTCLKQRLLKSMGWTLISIPFWEWTDLQGDTVKQDHYCQELLKKYEKYNSMI
jgi:RAP domain